MSHWESVPFDILQLELSYLNLEDPKIIRALCGDPVLNFRLQCNDPNGFLWKYLMPELFKDRYGALTEIF